MNLGFRVGLVGLVLLPACDSAGAASRAPAYAAEAAGAGCSLEGALSTFGDKTTAPGCGHGIAGGVCDEGCKEGIRKCVLESARAMQPFAVAWTNAMVNGVGTRRAVVGRAATSKEGAPIFEVTWLDYVWINGFDAVEATMTKHRVRITAHYCTDIADLQQSCDPRLPNLSPLCGQSSKQTADDAWMHCEGTEEIFCSE